MKAMILAAGLGTRLAPYTDVLAKPAIPFLNIPLFYYSIALLKASRTFSIDECIINSHHKPGQIRVLAEALKGIKTTVTFEEGAPLGSGGGIWFAREFFKNEKDFIVANGDEVILPTRLDVIDRMFDQHTRSGAMATLLVKRDARVGSQFGGVWTEPSGEVFGFGKASPRKGLEGLHYVGVIILNNRALKYLPEGESNILYDAVLNGKKAGEKIEVFIDDCRWYETGNIKDFLIATGEVLLELKKNPHDIFLNHLMKEFAPTSHFISDGVFAERTAKVDKNARLTGFVVLGSGVNVPAGCLLHNIVVSEHAVLEARSYRDDLIL